MKVPSEFVKPILAYRHLGYHRLWRRHVIMATVIAVMVGVLTLVIAPAVSAIEVAGWDETSSMRTPRDYHVATKLSDGRVLVAGSSDPSLDGVFAEIFDPATAT